MYGKNVVNGKALIFVDNYFSKIKNTKNLVDFSMNEIVEMRCLIVTTKSETGAKEQSYLIKGTFYWIYNKTEDTITFIFCLSGLIDIVVTRKNCIKPKFDNLLCTLNLVFREEKYEKEFYNA